MDWEAGRQFAAPGCCHLLILPIGPGPFSRLSHAVLRLTATRERAERKGHSGAYKTRQQDRRTASYRQTVLLTWAKLPRVGFSPRARGSHGAGTGVRVGRAAVKLLSGSEEVMRQEEGLLWASPPSTSDSFSAGQQLGLKWWRGGWDRGCHPVRVQQECGSEERRKKIFTSWAQNNNKITRMFAKAGAGLGKEVGRGRERFCFPGAKESRLVFSTWRGWETAERTAKPIYGSNTGV